MCMAYTENCYILLNNLKVLKDKEVYNVCE